MTFALVDVNNFYCSCERLFRPDLKHRPVVVLSNNDGCCVARSQEAKNLGIKMGSPLFKVRNIISENNVVAFSSNYALYADISARVMTTLESLAPEVEVYSIDEAFLNLSGFEKNIGLESFGRYVKYIVDRDVGMPVCVGIGQTKTLAKLANHAAKHYPATRGVVDLTSVERQRKLMSLVDAEEVWGIGGRLAKRLKKLGINTALDFADAPPEMIRKHGSVVLLRTQCELNGEVCHTLEPVEPAKKQIVCSRSFGKRVINIKDMQEALCVYVTRAAEKLRAENRAAKSLSIYLRTSAFTKNESRYSNGASTSFIYPTTDTREFIRACMRLLDSIWKQGYNYAKAGVMLSDFHEVDAIQTDMFQSSTDHNKHNTLMRTVDKINSSGKGSVFFARQGISNDWKMQRSALSPRYTTSWRDIPKVK